MPPSALSFIAPSRAAVKRSLVAGLAASAIFAALLTVAGKDPLKAYSDALKYVFGNSYGFSELIVRMVPLIFTAIAAALPARLGLINVGGEGQLIMGAVFATGGALALADRPSWIVLPAMAALGFAGGALWAFIPGVLRAARLVNETISTLLLNYVSPLVLSALIFGPWRSEESAAYPESPAFGAAARLPAFFHTRVHAGLLIGLLCLFFYWLVLAKSRWGLHIRAIGVNPEAARRLGLPVFGYTTLAMTVAGGVAGLGGMAEVSAIQGKLVTGISPGYGFAGFLAAWLAGTRALGILSVSFLFAIIGSVGDILQVTQGVPYAVINILMAALLFVVLSQRGGARR
jgi:general nucleoside transport system permease protein